MMSVSVEFLPGPFTSEMPRSSAEGALRHHPAIQKGAAYALEQVDGRWVAAVVHEAEVPFAGGGPADSDEEAPGPKSEGPDDVEPSEDSDSDDSKFEKPDGDSESGPSKHDKGDKSGELHQVLDALHAIAEALGVPLGLDASPVPGAEDGSAPVPPPAGPPHGLDGPPGPPGGPDAQHVVHQRVTKPGETPPGGTPIGAPAFASVREDHPWAHLANKIASFEVSDKIGDASLTNIQDELHTLASEIGYRVSKFREDRNDEGDRVGIAVITKH